jgi:hypothetical protein
MLVQDQVLGLGDLLLGDQVGVHHEVLPTTKVKLRDRPRAWH